MSPQLSMPWPTTAVRRLAVGYAMAFLLWIVPVGCAQQPDQTADDVAISSQTIVSARLFGGTSAEDPFGCMIDSTGHLIIVGQTRSHDFPRTHGPAHSRGRNLDGFLLEMDANGEIVSSRLFGGGARDDALGVVMDSDENLYIVGTTSSSDFPTTPGAYDRTYNGGDYGDAFAMKLNRAGEVLWSTFLGGQRPDRSRAVLAVDTTGRLYVGGRTESRDFPTTPGAYGCRAGPPECEVRVPFTDESDAFLARLSADGSRLEVSTLFGGKGEDALYGELIVVPGRGILAGGTTTSADLPTTPGAFDTSYNGACPGCSAGDAFVALFSPDLDELRMATFIGGSSRDNPSNKAHLRLDRDGRIYMLGNTRSADFPVSEGSPQARSGPDRRGDPFVAILSADGSRLVRAAILGGSGEEEPSGLAIRADGSVVITGETTAEDFPTTPDAPQRTYGGGAKDIFISVLSADLSTLLFSTYWGGSGRVRRPYEWGDINRCLASAPDGSYVTIGYTSSLDFPTTSGPPHAGSNDGYVLTIKIPLGQ